ncbi:flavin reductase [Velocimicrobium porci]|uniref:Flavin reductase n=1 Tax=Velocimicrobium porci TaxID=2606634 RepID=A0A6L5XZ56_9FIRM|nr:flavin reductase [Velocimicrobium porci]MSS63488.1 flavin reductase [Velocimicrobium porci]
MNKSVFHKLSYGVYVVSTWDEGRATGCVANSIMQITSDPATIAVSMNHNNYTHSCIEQTKKFAVSILSEQSDPSIIGTFGFQSGKEVNKFEQVEYELKEYMPVLKDCCGYIVCEVIDKLETNTHTVFLGRVVEGDLVNNEKEMTYNYYHKVVKGKSPKNAPTYIEEEATKEEIKEAKYVCGICGYVYDGEIPFEELPDDYVCPICKQPKRVFKKQ